MLKETHPENWLNSGAGDFVAQLKPPDLSDIVDKVVDMEATASHWSLFNRFCMANDVLDAADAAGACVMPSCSLSHCLGWGLGTLDTSGMLCSLCSCE